MQKFIISVVLLFLCGCGEESVSSKVSSDDRGNLLAAKLMLENPYQVTELTQRGEDLELKVMSITTTKESRLYVSSMHKGFQSFDALSVGDSLRLVHMPHQLGSYDDPGSFLLPDNTTNQDAIDQVYSSGGY